jgi:hypothetical protein
MKDIVTGMLYLAIGLFFNYYSRNYAFGTSQAMGPGYFPTILSTGLIILGIWIASIGVYKKWNS